MITCPHCGATNRPGVVFCAQCQTNVHYRKKVSDAEQQLTPEEAALTAKKRRAEAVLWGCIAVIAIAGLIVGGVLLSVSSTPEGGFAGMVIMNGVMLLGPILLIPAMGGIVMALRQKWKVEAELRELKREDATKGVD